jgi:hypothetical protein
VNRDSHTDVLVLRVPMLRTDLRKNPRINSGMTPRHSKAAARDQRAVTGNATCTQSAGDFPQMNDSPDGGLRPTDRRIAGSSDRAIVVHGRAVRPMSTLADMPANQEP